MTGKSNKKTWNFETGIQIITQVVPHGIKTLALIPCRIKGKRIYRQPIFGGLNTTDELDEESLAIKLHNQASELRDKLRAKHR